jgi:transposase-like protein
MQDNFPTVDSSAVRSSYKLIDFSKLIFKSPGDTDILQSREYYGDDAQISSMRQSVLSKGVLESPIVMETDDGENYRVLEGNRRCYIVSLLIAEGETATANGKALSKLKCEVRPSVMNIVEDIFGDWHSLNADASDELQEQCREYVRKQVMLEMGQDALIRNTQRLNWSPIEMARQIQAQLEGGTPMSELCKQFGLAENTINARLALLSKEDEMPEVIAAVDNQEIGFSVGKLLSNVKDSSARAEILEVAKGRDEEAKPSTSEVKEIIDAKHQESVDAGGEGIKAQDRKKRTPKTPTAATATAKPKVIRKPVRSAEAILEVISDISTTRVALGADEDDDLSINASMDLGVAIKVLQWVITPDDNNSLEDIILGQSES